MRQSRRSGFRSGFTLLEIILATAIGVLLLFAVYSAFNMQLRLLNAGRDAVDESVLARAVLARMGNDISSQLPPLVIPQYGASSSGTSGSGTSGSGSSGTSGGSGSGTGGSSSGTGSSSSSSSSGTSTTNGLNGTTNSGTLNSLASNSAAVGSNSIVFNLGVQGDNNQLTLYVCRWPREVVNLPLGTVPPVAGDVRRITYWLAGGPSSSQGLARQEVKISTSDDALTGTPVGTGDEANSIIAEEVQTLQFRYFDGANWQDTWDGTVAGNTSNTNANSNMIGPPVAIEITISLAPAGKKASNSDPNDPNVKYYRHVVAIPTANFPLTTNSFTGNMNSNTTNGSSGSNSNTGSSMGR